MFPGKLRSADIFRTIPVTSDTSVEEIMVSALDKFGLDASDINKFRLSEVTLDKGSVHERVMDNQECPWELLRGIARVSFPKEVQQATLKRTSERSHVCVRVLAVYLWDVYGNFNRSEHVPFRRAFIDSHSDLFTGIDSAKGPHPILSPAEGGLL